MSLPSLMAGLFALSTATGSFFLTVYFREGLGFSGAQIGLLYALQAGAGIIAAFPVGLGSDRIHARRLVAWSLALQAAGFALLAVLRDFLAFAAAFLLWNLANGAFRYSLDILVLKRDRGTGAAGTLGRYQATRFAGLALGAALNGYLLALLPFSQALLATAAATAGLVLLSLALPPSPLQRAGFSSYRQDLAAPGVRFFCVWLVLFATHWGAEFTSYSLFLRQDLGLSLVEMGWYLGSEFATLTVTMVLLSRLPSTTVTRRPMVVAGLLASGIGHIGMVFQPTLLSCAFRCLHGIGDGVVLLVFYLGINRFFVAERLGGNSGVVNTMTMIGMVIGALVFGPLGESLGYGIPLWTSGLLTMLLALPVMRHREPAAPR